MFFSFGDAYALRLLVAVHTLRQVYDGPVTVFLGKDDAGAALHAPLDRLRCDVIDIDQISKSWARHRLFLEGPYSSTLIFDSDLIFRSPIDALWEPLERSGVLFTRFYPPPYGVEGSEECPGWSDCSTGFVIW